MEADLVLLKSEKEELKKSLEKENKEVSDKIEKVESENRKLVRDNEKKESLLREKDKKLKNLNDEIRGLYLEKKKVNALKLIIFEEHIRGPVTIKYNDQRVGAIPW